MSQIEIIQCIGFLMPMFTALLCLLVLAMSRTRSEDPTRRRLRRLMVLTYAMAVLCWFGVVLIVVDYGAFVWYNTLFFFALMLDQVLLYHFVFSITGTGRGWRFRRIHYIIPVVLTAIISVWTLLTPYDELYRIVETRAADGYTTGTLVFTAVMPVFMIYNILYPLLGLFRIKKYRREVVNYSADEQRASAGWMYGLIVLIWFTLPISAGVVLFSKSAFFSSWLVVPGSFLPIFQYLIICYNLIAGNYVIIAPPESLEESGKPKRIDRKRFEAYMAAQKPYLDPKLKITDMCAALGTNRSYISAFINKEYGMNFSRYINGQRLEELDRIRIAPENKNMPGGEMVLTAGFSCYNSYLRVKNAEDARRTVGF